jgi:hypothetical protein
MGEPSMAGTMGSTIKDEIEPPQREAKKLICFAA